MALPEHVEKSQIYRGPGRELQELRERGLVRNVGGRFSQVPMRMTLEPYEAG